MENKALISVIIPVYNVEKYLRECIDSVLNQTYTEYEIILVDDGSTDYSGKICDDYAEKYDCISVIHKENGGLSKARNFGIENSKGEYIYFLDSDDYIIPEAFEKLIFIIQKEKSDFVFFDSYSFADPEGSFEVNQNYIRKHSYKTDAGFKVLSELQNNKEYHSAVPLLFLKRDFYEKSELCFVPGILHEDMIFTYQAFFKAEAVSHCNEALYFRRYHKNSIMTSKKSVKHFEGCACVYRESVKFSDENKIINESAAKKYISRCAFNVFNVFENLNAYDKKACKKELEEIKKDIIKNNAFSDAALKSRCCGKIFWVIYKLYEKTFGRLLKG